MVKEKQNSNNVSQSKNKRILLVLVVPLLSCMFSSVVGIALGQVSKQIYKVIGGSAICLVIPSFVSLFFITFALSFFSNKLLRKWLAGLRK